MYSNQVTTSSTSGNQALTAVFFKYRLVLKYKDFTGIPPIVGIRRWAILLRLFPIGYLSIGEVLR